MNGRDSGGTGLLAGCRVLLADDQEELRALVREMLEDEGCLVTEAGHGGEAIDQLDRREFDVIVSDVSMPVLGGLALLVRTRERQPRMASRFVFLTGDVEAPDAVALRTTSGCPVLAKLSSRVDLVRAVRQARLLAAAS